MTEGRINRFFPVQIPVIQWHELSATGIMGMICLIGLDITKKIRILP